MQSSTRGDCFVPRKDNGERVGTRCNRAPEQSRVANALYRFNKEVGILL